MFNNTLLFLKLYGIKQQIQQSRDEQIDRKIAALQQGKSISTPNKNRTQTTKAQEKNETDRQKVEDLGKRFNFHCKIIKYFFI